MTNVRESWEELISWEESRIHLNERDFSFSKGKSDPSSNASGRQRPVG
jgi:hypothetical protein